MQSFLDHVAETILKNHTGNMERICLVTPNRRAGLFLKKYFAQRVQSALWAPDVFSMEDFVSRVTGLQVQEPVALLLEFYKVYLQVEGSKAESLEEFLKWAPMLMKDFNDVDAQLHEPQNLFENVLDAKRIEAWNPDGRPLSDFQKKYLHFFEKFKQYHLRFRGALLDKHMAYQGLAFRTAAQSISDTVLPWEKIYFTGFNALSQAEEAMIQNLSRQGKAELLWDADKYYVENPHHEAGAFLRKHYNIQGNRSFRFMGDHFSLQSKNIRVYGVAKNVNQAKLAANILSSLPAQAFHDHQTALVLAAEDLLIPMLNSIPPNVDKLNVTMGYPLRKTSIYGLYDAFFQLHITTWRMKSAAQELKSAFYHKDLVRFFSHPAIAVLWDSQPFQIKPHQMVQQVLLSRKTFLSFRALASMSKTPDLFENLFAPFFQGLALHPDRIIGTLLHLTQLLDQAFRQKADAQDIPIENTGWFTDFEGLFPIQTILQKLDNLLEEQKSHYDLRTLSMLFQAMARETRLTLAGEPLAGLQIMGMLETRNLDFRNLIILSANEDILPAASGAQSLIPFDIKVKFGMPVHREKDAIYAYHFYRLLQRAENVHIIYNTQTQDIGSSEKSRFITQLQMEMPAYNPRIAIHEEVIALPPVSHHMDHEILISKSTDVLEQLKRVNEKGFSPSSLSHYIQCPLLFYFKHIARIQETITAEETIQANTLGTVVHHVLEQLYADMALENKALQPEYTEQMFGKIEDLTRQKFEEVYEGGDITSGKNLLLAKVAARYVKNYLHYEKELLKKLHPTGQQWIYKGSEEQLTLCLSLAGIKFPVRFNGFADRVDSLNGTLRIIDYKTGKVEKEELTIKEWPLIIQETRLRKSFQLMMYALLYSGKHQLQHPLMPGIISFRNVSAGLMTLTHPTGAGMVGNEETEAFSEQLGLLMNDIFNPDIPFCRTQDENNCAHCDFRVVCHR